MERQRYEFGPFVLDLRRKALLKHGNDLQAGQRALTLLETLLAADGKPVSKADLMDAAWPGASVEESNLTVQIAALRKLLGQAPGGGDWIVTVQRLGYQLALPDAPQQAQPASVPPAPDNRPSIAVLPFDNMSPDPDQQFFSDGITEDITTALSRLKGFFVIARNTMFTYKGKPVNVRALGQELGVRYLLEGSVRSAGGRVRVTAQLVDTSTGSHLWSERYDRVVSDIFVIQDEITSNVIACIGPELLTAEHARAARKPPENLDAWECFVRALFLSARQSREESAAALALLDRAIASDPGYAEALGLKSWIVVWRAIQGWSSLPLAVAEADTASLRAVDADAGEPWAWLGRGAVGLASRNAALSIPSLERAIELNPNFAFGHGMLALALAFAGRPAEAIVRLEAAVKFSPREIFQGAFAQQFAFAHFQAGNYDLALESATRAHQLRPGHIYPMVVGAASAGFLGRPDLATNFAGSVVAALPGASLSFFEATAPFILAEDRQRLTEGLRIAGLR